MNQGLKLSWVNMMDDEVFEMRKQNRNKLSNTWSMFRELSDTKFQSFQFVTASGRFIGIESFKNGRSVEERLHTEEELLHQGRINVDEMRKVLQKTQDRLAGDASAV